VSAIKFEWDKAKESSNRSKHGLSFAEAQTVFVDETGLLLDDPDHSGDEDRYILLGMSAAARLLVVCHTYRRNDQTIRIISARKATRSEQEEYRKRWKP
jgi:uncharacterized protein